MSKAVQLPAANTLQKGTDASFLLSVSTTGLVQLYNAGNPAVAVAGEGANGAQILVGICYYLSAVGGATEIASPGSIKTSCVPTAGNIQLVSSSSDATAIKYGYSFSTIFYPIQPGAFSTSSAATGSLNPSPTALETYTVAVYVHAKTTFASATQWIVPGAQAGTPPAFTDAILLQLN
jgi:hypothetical protein